MILNHRKPIAWRADFTPIAATTQQMHSGKVFITGPILVCFTGHATHIFESKYVQFLTDYRMVGMFCFAGLGSRQAPAHLCIYGSLFEGSSC